MFCFSHQLIYLFYFLKKFIRIIVYLMHVYINQIPFNNCTICDIRANYFTICWLFMKF